MLQSLVNTNTSIACYCRIFLFADFDDWLLLLKFTLNILSNATKNFISLPIRIHRIGEISSAGSEF